MDTPTDPHRAANPTGSAPGRTRTPTRRARGGQFHFAHLSRPPRQRSRYIGSAGRSATWPATPLTSSSRSSASPSTTPCDRSSAPKPKTAAGIVTCGCSVRHTRSYDASANRLADSRSHTRPVRCHCGKNLSHQQLPQNSQSRRRATTPAWQSGCKTRRQSGRFGKPLRHQFGKEYDVKKVGNNYCLQSSSQSSSQGSFLSRNR